MTENENTAPEDLPEFLNTEPDTTGEGLICPETGDRLSWEDLDHAYLENKEGLTNLDTGGSVRDFLEKTQQNLYSNQTCRVRISDLDGYEHLSFAPRKDTNLNTFNNVFGRDMLDAGLNVWGEYVDEEGRTIFITADIEL